MLKDTGKFEKVKIVPLSAAQLMLPGDVVSDGSDDGNDRARGRIEIRVRRTTATIANRRQRMREARLSGRGVTMRLRPGRSPSVGASVPDCGGSPTPRPDGGFVQVLVLVSL